MCEVVKALIGFDVVADTIVVVGFGESDEVATLGHEWNQEVVLQCSMKSQAEFQEVQALAESGIGHWSLANLRGSLCVPQ